MMHPIFFQMAFNQTIFQQKTYCTHAASGQLILRVNEVYLNPKTASFLF